MIFRIILLAIFAIPFVTSIAIEPLIPYSTGDPRLAREIITNILLCAIAGYGALTGKTTPIKNKFIIFACFYPIITIPLLPPLIIPYGPFNIVHMWIWKPIAQGFLYLMAMQTMCYLLKPHRRKEAIMSIISWTGIVMGAFMILQFLGFDQFFVLKDFKLIGYTNIRPEMAGTLGNYTLASALIAVALTITILKKHLKRSIFLAAVMLLASSDLALIATILTTGFMLIYQKRFLILSCLISLLLLSVIIAYAINPEIIQKVKNDNGRIGHWAIMLKAWNSPLVSQPVPDDVSAEVAGFVDRNNKRTYQITGTGGDSYRYLFLMMAKDRGVVKWDRAHNELLEMGLFNHGIIGFFLYLLTFWSLIKRYKDENRQIAMAVVICIFFLSLGTFILHVEPFRIYAMLMIAILLSPSRDFT